MTSKSSKQKKNNWAQIIIRFYLCVNYFQSYHWASSIPANVYSKKEEFGENMVRFIFLRSNEFVFIKYVMQRHVCTNAYAVYPYVCLCVW